MLYDNRVVTIIADPVILPKFLIPDSKSDENFDPWSYMKNTADPDPGGCDPRSWVPPLFLVFDPWSHIPRYDPEKWEEKKMFCIYYSTFMISSKHLMEKGRQIMYKVR